MTDTRAETIERDEIKAWLNDARMSQCCDQVIDGQIAKAIRLFSTILSTEAAPSEPVAWMHETGKDCIRASSKTKMRRESAAEYNIPLYSRPPAQPEQADDEPQVTHCPFCNRDPFHRSDSGEAVAVTCCDLGDLLFRGARPEPETVEIAWGDFCKIAEKLVAAKCYAVASQKEVALKNINPAFDELWKNRPWEIHGRSDKDKALGWFTAGVDHALTAQPDTTKSGSEG